jgi:uroporphyrinogen-III synthase/uroporphyrinogen III methyltransferase/synthase
VTTPTEDGPAATQPTGPSPLSGPSPLADPSPLAGIRVLIPRTVKRGATLAEALTAAGAEPLAVPLIAIEPPEDWTPFDAAIGSLARGEYDWLVVTSLSTVDALVDRAELVGLDLATLLGSPHAPQSDDPPALVAAVGASTARELARHDVPVALIPKLKQWAGGLVAEFPHPTEDSKPVLVPQGDLADDTVLTGLGALGWEPHSVRAYRTVAAPDPDPHVASLFSSGGVDAIVLTSGSTARRLVEVFGIPPSSTIVCCIGPRTAEMAREYGLTVTAVAKIPSYQGIMGALSSALTDRAAER